MVCESLAVGASPVGAGAAFGLRATGMLPEERRIAPTTGFLKSVDLAQKHTGRRREVVTAWGRVYVKLTYGRTVEQRAAHLFHIVSSPNIDDDVVDVRELAGNV